MNKALMSTAQRALDLAVKAGADQAAVKVSRSRFVDVSIKDGEPDRASASTRQGLSLRLFMDGRFAVHSTSDLRPEALAGFISEAAALTKALEPDRYRSLPDPARYAKEPAPALELFDPALDQAPAGFWAHEAVQMETLAASAAKDAGPQGVSVSGGAYGESAFGYLVDTNGFQGALEETGGFVGCSMVFLDPEDGTKRRSGWWWEGSRRLEPISGPETLKRIARLAVERGLMEMGAKPGPSGRYALLVENQAARNLIGHLLGAMSGQTLHNKHSYLAGRLHESIASGLLTMSDEPLIAGGMGSRWFDAEGVASKPLVMIQGGRLERYYLNTYYSRQLGLAPTTASSSNIVLQASHDQDFAAMLADVDQGLAVTGFLGGNFNSTTGDFSLGVKGLWVEGGKVKHAVEGMNMAGNALDLWRELIKVGNDPYVFSPVRTPSLLFKEVQLSGA
jgi:PmbA protein